MDTKRIVGYGTIGVGVVFALVGVISALEVNSVKNDPVYTSFQGTGSNGAGPRYAADVCDFAKNPGTFSSFHASDGGVHGSGEVVNLCSKASTFETLQLVTFPLAAIAGGVGVYLVATSGKTKTEGAAKRNWELAPQIGLGSGKVDFKLTF